MLDVGIHIFFPFPLQARMHKIKNNLYVFFSIIFIYICNFVHKFCIEGLKHIVTIFDMVLKL